MAVASVASIAWQQALANPTGPTVAHGSASFATSGSTLTVTNTPSAIINWQGFSIGAGELTKFNQQSAASAVLNRVTTQNPSTILGSLQSNGRVFLINPGGIVFGAGSRVDVAGLVASSLALSDSDFLAGRMRFASNPGAGAVVSNGMITTVGAGAPVYLVGPSVTNGGIITSPQGEVILAAGNSVEVADPGTPGVNVLITAPDNEALNLGSILADSGRINIYAGLINQNGLVRADTAVAGQDGIIVLRATGSANFGVGSRTTASESFENGGSIEISAGDVLISGDIFSQEQTIRASRDITIRPGPPVPGTGIGLSVASESGPQTVEAGGTLRIEGGARGGASLQSVFYGGSQSITASNIELVGAAGYPRGASIYSQEGQTITVNNGGSLSLQGQTSISTGWRDQLIDFPSGGALTVAADAVNEDGSAAIRSGRNQSITGSPSVALTGGTSFNFARIAAAGTQSIHADDMTLAGGTHAGSFAEVIAPRQQINVAGDLTMIGGGAPYEVGALIGGGRDGAAGADLLLNVAGNATLTGGRGMASRVAIGSTSGVGGGERTDVVMNIGGDLTLNPGSDEWTEAIIGWAGPSLRFGDIAVSAGGSIVLNDGGWWAQGTGIRTQGNVSLVAGNSITQGEYAYVTADAVDAESLSVKAQGPITLPGLNQVSRFSATGGGGLVFTNTSSSPLDVAGIRLEGPLALRQGGSLLVTGEVVSGPQTFWVGRDMTLQGGDTRGAHALLYSAGDIDLTVGGLLRLNQGSHPRAWARVQTESRDSTITLHFPNLSSGGWLVNGVEGAIRSRQSGFLSGHGTAAIGRSVIVDYGP